MATIGRCAVTFGETISQMPEHAEKTVEGDVHLHQTALTLRGPITMEEPVG